MGDRYCGCEGEANQDIESVKRRFRAKEDDMVGDFIER